MDVRVSYTDFIKLCRVDTPADWDGFHVKPEGVFVTVPPDDLDLAPEERAALAWHPTGEYTEPALQLPCGFDDLQSFLEEAGLYGCIDPFVMAKFVLSRSKGDDPTPKGEAIEGKSRTTALKIIGGLVMSTYKVNIHAERLDGIGEIEKDLERVGASVGQKTLREWIKEAAGAIDPLKTKD